MQQAHRVQEDTLTADISYINEHVASFFYGIKVKTISLQNTAHKAGFYVDVFCDLADGSEREVTFLLPYLQLEKSRGSKSLEDTLVTLLFGVLTRELSVNPSEVSGLLRDQDKSSATA